MDMEVDVSKETPDDVTESKETDRVAKKIYFEEAEETKDLSLKENKTDDVKGDKNIPYGSNLLNPASITAEVSISKQDRIHEDTEEDINADRIQKETDDYEADVHKKEETEMAKGTSLTDQPRPLNGADLNETAEDMARRFQTEDSLVTLFAPDEMDGGAGFGKEHANQNEDTLSSKHMTQDKILNLDTNENKTEAKTNVDQISEVIDQSKRIPQQHTSGSLLDRESAIQSENAATGDKIGLNFDASTSEETTGAVHFEQTPIEDRPRLTESPDRNMDTEHNNQTDDRVDQDTKTVDTSLEEKQKVTDSQEEKSEMEAVSENEIQNILETTNEKDSEYNERENRVSNAVNTVDEESRTVDITDKFQKEADPIDKIKSGSEETETVNTLSDKLHEEDKETIENMDMVDQDTLDNKNYDAATSLDTSLDDGESAEKKGDASDMILQNPAESWKEIDGSPDKEPADTTETQKDENNAASVTTDQSDTEEPSTSDVQSRVDKNGEKMVDETEDMDVTHEGAGLSAPESDFPESKVNPHHLPLMGKFLEDMRTGGHLCDITINVKDTKLKAHKLILSAASPVLHSLVEGKENVLSEFSIIPDVSPSAVEVFIHYLYTGELLLKAADMIEVEKLATEYNVQSLNTVLHKTLDICTGELVLKSVHTQTEFQTAKFDILVKTKNAKSKPDKRVHGASDQKQTSKVKTDSRNKYHTQNVRSVQDNDSQLLDSDDGDDVSMDFSENEADEDDLLNDSPLESNSLTNLSKSVQKLRDRKHFVDKSGSKEVSIQGGSNACEQEKEQAKSSKISPRKQFPNLAERLQAMTEARLKREMSLTQTLASGSRNRQHKDTNIHKETAAPNNQDKSLNLKVRVEKLPPNINPNVTVVVNDDEDLKDSELEFVSEKYNEKGKSGQDLAKREFTLEEKEQIALEAKRYGTTQTSKARNIPLPDILNWMTFFGLRKASDNVSKKYGKQVNHEADLSIVRWIVQQQELNGSVNLDAMRNYALAVYRQSQPTFVASKTWLANFFKRNISVLQGTNFIHGGEEGGAKSEPVPVKLTQLPLLVDPVMASIESQVNEQIPNMSSRTTDQHMESIGVTNADETEIPEPESEVGGLQPDKNSKAPEEVSQCLTNALEDSSKLPTLEGTSSISDSVSPSEDTGAVGISKELLAKIRSKPVVIGTAVMFDAKTERKLAEWLIEKQQQDGYVYRDDFIAYAKSVHKGNKRFQGSQGWTQLFMRRNSVKMPLLKKVMFKSKFKTYYSDEEKVAIVQQARKLGVPHVAKMLGINSGVIHSWKVGMDAEERKKGGPRNFEKVTRSVTRAFPSVSKEVDEIIDSTLKDRIKARIDVSKRKASTNANRGPDPELEGEAIEKIKEAGIVRYQDVQKICYEIYSKKRPDFQASRSWVLKFVNNHVLGLEEVELLKSWLVYPEKNQLRLKYADKMNILEEEKINGIEETAQKRSISCATIRFWKKYPPSPEDDEEEEEQNDSTADSSGSRKIRTNEFEYVPSKFQAGKKVRRRVVIGDAVMFSPEQELQLVQWIHDHMMADNSVYTDDFRQYAKSLYNGDKSFSASSTWLTKFIRRNPILREVKFISKYKRFFTEEEKYAAVMEARRFGTSYVAKKLNCDSGLINSWKVKFAKYSAKKMARLKQSMQLDRAPLQSAVTEREALPPAIKPSEIENPEMTLEEIEKEVGSGLHSYKGEIPVFEREIVQLVIDEDKEKGGVTYEDISRLCRSVYERTRPHFKASDNWTREFIKRHEEDLSEVNILNRKKLFVDDEPLNASTSKLYRRNRNGIEPTEVSPVLQKIMSKKPVLLGQSRTLDPQMERKLVQWMVQKQEEDGYVFVDEFNEYAKSLYKGKKKFAATQAWRILFFKRNKAALKHVKLESKYRKQFTREEKMAIVAEARRLGIGHVARKLDVNSSLIYSWGFGKTPQLTQDELANERIEQDVGKGLYSQRGSVPALENEIVRLIHEKQNQDGSISYDDISNICRDVYKETRPNFKASYNWTMEFIKRHKEELKGVDIENMKKVYYENGDEEQPGLQSFINTLNQNMDTDISDSLVQIENLEREQHGIDFHAHSYEESDLNLNDLLHPGRANPLQVKQEPMEESGAESRPEDEASSAAILERIRASKPDIVALPKTFDLEVEKKMVEWLKERQGQNGYVFTDDFVDYAKSLYTGSESFSGSQTWRKNFLRRHGAEVKHVIFRSKHVNQYTEEERQMVVEEARKLGVAHVAKQCGLDHRLVWSWKMKADQDNKAKQKAFWKGPKKTTSVVSKPLNVKHAIARPNTDSDEPLGDAYRGVVPEFEDRIIKKIIKHQNKEGSISYEEISEISRNIYQETRPNFKAGYGWIKNFLQRHKNKLKNIDIENMKKLYLPDDDAFVPASGKNIREVSGYRPGSETSNLVSPTSGGSDKGSVGNTLESLQRIIARKPIVLGVPKSFNAKTEKKLVQWLLDQQAEQGYAFLDEFKDYASSLYTGDKKFAATNAWRTQFFRRNHAALKHVKLVSKFRKTFTEEEKIAIVKEAKRLGVGHVSRQLDIGHGNINVWMRELEAKGRISSGIAESQVVSEASNSSSASVKGKRKQSVERSASVDSRHSSKESSNTAEEEEEENETGSGLYSARGIVPVFEKQIVEEVLEYYRVNESIKYDDISRISQNIYKETRPTFKASHNWIKDFMSRHADKLGHLVIQNAREFLTQKEKREVLAEVEKHGLQYVSKVTNISQAQLLAWKEQLKNAPPPIPTPTSAPSTPVQTTTDRALVTTPPTVYSANGTVHGGRARKYSLEDKKKYAAESEKHGIAYVSNRYNVPKTNLGRWMKEYKTQNEKPECAESKMVAVSEPGYSSELDKKLVSWVLERDEEIGVVVVTHVLDFAQETISGSVPTFQASEEWLSKFISRNSDRLKNISFRYPEEVTKNKLNFTQQQKDRLCEASNHRPVVEVATLAGIYPYTLYDWRKHYKRKQLKAASESYSPGQRKSPSELLIPKTEPEETDSKSTMQEKLARIENKYNAIQKQEIADKARNDGTTSTAKKRGIPLPLVLKWMKTFPESVPAIPESPLKSIKSPKSKSVSKSRSKSSELTPKSAIKISPVRKLTSGNKANVPKENTGLKVKLPAPTKKFTYQSKLVTPEEKRKFVMEFREEGAAAVSARTGIPKSTLYHWSKTYEEPDASPDTSKQPEKESEFVTPDISIKKEVVDIESFTLEQKKEIALETKSLGFEATAKKRGLPTAVVIEWMGLYLDQSPPSEKVVPSTTPEKSVTHKRVYTEEEKCKIAEQALEIGCKETARLTGVHLSNVTRWTNAYKKRLKERQYNKNKKDKSQNAQDKNEKRHQLIQGIMKENVGTDESRRQSLSRSSSFNSESDTSLTSKTVGDFSFEDKLRVLQAADEMGVRNASVKYKVDPALIFQWRRLYDYTDSPNSVGKVPTATVTSSTSGSTSKSKTPMVITSTPKQANAGTSNMVTPSGSNEFDSIVISDDEGSCSPCSNHSWQSDEISFDAPLTAKRKSDFTETDLSLSAKRSRLELNQHFGVEEDVATDVIDFAFTPEQKQSIVRESSMYGIEKVSKKTNIPISLIMSWKSQFPHLASVKTEKY